MVGGAKSFKELSQFKYEKLRFGNTQSSKNIVTSPNKDGKSSSDVKTGNKPSSSGSESPWLTSSKPTKNGSLANGIKRYSQQSSNSKGVSRKRVRCIVSSDEDDDVRRDNHNKKLKIEENDQKSSPDKLENSKKDIFMLCLKFPTVQRPDIVRILRESNFNVESATVKLTALRKAKSSESPEKKNNFGSIKAFKVNRMMERMNTSNTSNNSMVSNSPNKGEGSPQVKKMKRVKVVESDSESEVKDKNADDDDLEEDKEEEKKGDPIMQGMVLSFLSSATLEELTSLNGCSKKKAESVINMRPFESWEDLDRKLEENRQLGHWLVEECQDLLKVRDNVKQLMESCQMISANLESSISDIMGGQGTHPSGGRSKCGYLVKQPAILSPGLKLTPYQMIGINWLIMMHSHKLNGILGDEMGLGKTIQTIAFLAHLLSQGNRGPHVIVCPSSTIDNWLRELQKWCPAMKVVPYYGTQEERRDLRSQLLDEGMEVNVILTSYNMASGSLEDKVLFKKYKYVYAIFDEGHMLKNMASSRYKNLTRISAERRLLLTGTPLQNNLLELISLLCFLMPDIFAGKTDHLKKIFSAAKNEKTDASANDGRGTYVQETLKQAKRILQPFFLRRLKADVLQQLPKKTEHTLRVTLTPSQQDLYTDLKTRFMRDVTEKNPLSSGASMMMQLRKAANHELLHRKNYEDSKLKAITKKLLKDPEHRSSDENAIYEDLQFMSDFEIHSLCKKYKVLKDHCLPKERILSSGKFKQLDDLLPTMKKKGDKVLLFSQFTMVLDIVEVYMEERNHKYLRLDGSTPVIERQELIDQFSEDDDIFVFLLSTKAGGMGINLVAANVVILHDIDFNPYNDKQAEDRCHRVGQTRDVTLYRLIGKNTIEEAMLKCAQEKLKLEREVTSTSADEEMNSGDVASMLKEALKMK